MKIEEIVFDEEDKNLFLIDDIELKADAIRYSILPRIEIINNELISRITNIFEFNFFEDYSVSKTPHFRLSKNQRKEPTKTNYTYSGVSITGQRKDNKWLGLSKGTDKVPKIQLTSLSIDLTTNGLGSNFYFNWPRNFTRETYRKFFDFFINRIDYITGLANKSEFKYISKFIDVFSIKEDFELRFEDEDYTIHFILAPERYPITYSEINNVIFSNILFFPVINSCIEIALGNKERIEQDIKILENKIVDYIEKFYNYEEEKAIAQINEDVKTDLLVKVEEKIKVQAGIRWQVFKRDKWKCVSCGRSAENNIILHIDHIIPRSKGGKNEMDNYQTLCETCNIGKSNKDETDLRSKNNYSLTGLI